MIRQSESIVKLAAALVAAQADMPAVPKNATGQVGPVTRSYADLASVLSVVQPVLAAHQLAFTQFPHGGTGGEVSIITRLLHESGEWMECDASMPTGNGAQAVGSALTYLKRYSLSAILGLATEDDDGAAASQPAPRARTRPAPPATDKPAGLMTEPQRKAMAASFRDLGITDRAERLAFIAMAIGHDVESSNDLSRPEIARVFDEINARKGSAA